MSCAVFRLGHLFSIFALLIYISGQDAHAAKRKSGRVKCPAVIGTTSAMTFQSSKGKACFKSAAAAKRAGYTQDGDPGVVNNPELDTERVYTGIGETSISPAFRVSTIARVVTVRVSECFDDSSRYAYIGRLDEILGEQIVLEQDTEVSTTFTNPGIYKIEISDGVLSKGSCRYSIRVQ